MLYREYRVEWEKVRKEKLQTEISQLHTKLNNLAVSSGEGEDVALISSLSAGREISDIYLAPMADEMTDDSEGEEVSGFNINGSYINIYIMYMYLVLLNNRDYLRITIPYLLYLL